MAQPSPLAFPDLQIYSRLLHALPQLFICNLVQPENSQYFPYAFINKDLQLGCYTFGIFPDFYITLVQMQLKVDLHKTASATK